MKTASSCYKEEISSMQRTQATKMRYYKFMHQIIRTLLIVMKQY